MIRLTHHEDHRHVLAWRDVRSRSANAGFFFGCEMELVSLLDAHELESDRKIHVAIHPSDHTEAHEQGREAS